MAKPMSTRVSPGVALACTLLYAATPGVGAENRREALALQRAPADRPVIEAGTPKTPLLVMDPMVLADWDGYHLFYSTLFAKRNGKLSYSWDAQANRGDPAEAPVSAIGYAFSADKGLTWQFRPTPVFAPGGGAWEQHKVETAFVVRREKELLLFYSALGYLLGRLMDNRFQLGVSRFSLGARSIKQALLATEESFQRFRSTPLVPFNVTQTSFLNNVQEPSVVCRGGRFEVYFLGLALSLPGETPQHRGQKIVRIGLGRAILDKEFRLIERTDKPLLEGVNMPEVTFHDGRYWLFSTGFGSGSVHKGEYLQVCTSDDGIRWSNPRALLRPRPKDEFDNWAVVAPTLVRDQGWWVVFYSAFGASPAQRADFRSTRALSLSKARGGGSSSPRQGEPCRSTWAVPRLRFSRDREPRPQALLVPLWRTRCEQGRSVVDFPSLHFSRQSHPRRAGRPVTIRSLFAHGGTWHRERTKPAANEFDKATTRHERQSASKASELERLAFEVRRIRVTSGPTTSARTFPSGNRSWSAIIRNAATDATSG